VVNNGETAVSMVNNVIENGSMVKPLNEVVKCARDSFHNDWRDFLTVYAEFCIKQKKLSKAVAYEYVRIAKKFVSVWKGDIDVNWNNFEPIKARVEEFLNGIPNPNTYRNALACLKIMFELLGDKGVLKDYKYKSVLPSFSIKTPSLEEVIIFDKNMRHEQVRLYYRLAIVSGIRPEHICRLTKGLIDTKTRTINTWQKEFGKKNFFFSFLYLRLGSSARAFSFFPILQ
jgi:integrase